MKTTLNLNQLCQSHGLPYSKPRTIKNNLTETEAQAHCSREDTHGNGWFDGYDYMKGCAPKGGR